MKVDSSAKVPPALSSRLKAGISHLLISSVSHLEGVFVSNLKPHTWEEREGLRTVCLSRALSTF